MTLLASAALSHQEPGTENSEDENGLALPVNPDEGIPLIPDQEGEVHAPS